MELVERLAERVVGTAPTPEGAVSILVVDDDEKDWLLTRRLFRAPALAAYTVD